MKEIKILTISTILLTIILTGILYLMMLNTLLTIFVSIIVGILFGLVLKKQKSKKQIIFSASILFLFFSTLIYLMIHLISPATSLSSTNNLASLMSIIRVPKPLNILIYFAGLNISFLYK